MTRKDKAISSVDGVKVSHVTCIACHVTCEM